MAKAAGFEGLDLHLRVGIDFIGKGTETEHDTLR